MEDAAALAGAAEVGAGVGVLLTGREGVGVGMAAPCDDVPTGTEALTEGREGEGAPESPWEPDESWHPVTNRMPPITTATDVPLRPGTACPLY